MVIKIRSSALRLLPITLIGMMVFISICDANLAFMANNNNPLGLEVETTFGRMDVPIAGHVGFGYQGDDGKFVFGSFGPSPGNLPLWAPGTLTVETFDDWAAVERYLITNYYTTYKLFNVENPNPQNAWETMERFKGSYYNLLTSVVDIKNSPLSRLVGASPERPDSENCITFAKKVLEAYGVQDLPLILPFITSAPNNYFLSIPGEIHSTILPPNAQQYKADPEKARREWATASWINANGGPGKACESDIGSYGVSDSQSSTSDSQSSTGTIINDVDLDVSAKDP